MHLATLKEKGQITLPAEIRKRIHVDKGDLFEVEVIDGKIIMIPQKLVPSQQADHQIKPEKVDLSKYIGSMSNIYGETAEEIDAYICQQREAWD